MGHDGPRGGGSRGAPDTLTRLDDGRLATLNLAPGVRVYEEDLVRIGPNEWRTWNPTRSKIGAYLLKSDHPLPIERASRVLYLGAANGTTVSHVSDVARDGTVWAVEFSPRSYRDLTRVAEKRPNLVPFLADAWRPELYERFVPDVDFLFQDIAQRQQAQIFAKNVNRFLPEWAMLAVKARSIDVARAPREVVETATREVQEATGYRVVDVVDLGPFEKDHGAVLLRRDAEA